MARINIEDTLWADDRFLQLVESTGNRASAIGAVVLAFKTAQRFWIPDQRPIPSVQFRSIPFSLELLSAGLAEEVEGGDFIYVKGTREQFAWLLQRSHAGRENKGKKRERKRTESNGFKRKLNGREPLTPSPSPPPTPSPDLVPVGESAGALPVPETVSNPIGFFIGRYRSAYQARYGAKARPALDGKTQGRIRRLLEDMPLERACDLIQTYCEMGDSWFLTKGHDFETFMQNQSKIGLKLDTGLAMTRTQIRQTDAASAAQDQLRRISEGTL